MNILLVSHYFWPESFIINELTTSLAANGHTIDVFTGKPNYPEGVVYPGYTAEGCGEDTFSDKIKVYRAPIYPRGKGGARRLSLNYLSFVLSGLFYFPRWAKTLSFDAIVVFAPSPITSVIPAMYLKKKFKRPLIVWVQDLWPESLQATGFIQNRFILFCVGKLVRWIYRSCDRLLVQSEAFKHPMTRYAELEKMHYYPNSYPDAQVNENAVLPSHLLEVLTTKRCFIFAGNLGTAQALETLMLAAQHLAHLTDCVLLLIGHGSMSPWLEKEIQVKKLNNVVLAGRFPMETMPSFFAKAMGLLVTLKRDPIFSYTIPSKVQAYLSAGKPLIAALDGEGARVILEAKAGLTGAAEDAVTLANNIEKIYQMSQEQREAMGKAGRSYFLNHFDMAKQSHRLIAILEESLNKRRNL